MLSVLLTILLVASRPDARGDHQPADDFDALREAFLEKVNAERAREGVGPLRLFPLLSRVAQQRAEEFARRGGPELPAPGGGALVRRVRETGYDPKLVAEVITRADGNVEEVVSAWREGDDVTWSEFVSGDFRDLGVGVAVLDEVPLYTFVFAITWEDYVAAKLVEYGDLERMRRWMLDRVNAERSQRRLPFLTGSRVLDRVAQAHADDMLRRSYYGHKSPDGLTVRERALVGGYELRVVGENIASGQSSVDEVMDGWMASDEHRPNILSSAFREVGFGLAIGKNKGGYQIIWVQVFGRPRLRFG